MISAPRFLAALAALAAESDSVLGRASGDGWAWGRLMDGLAGPFAVIAGLTLIILVSLRLRRKNRDLKGLEARPRSQVRAEGSRQALERMAVDLEEVARSISALLDTRIRVLDKLIRDADERVARLRDLGGEAGGAGPGSGEPAAAAEARPEAGAPAEEKLAHHAHIYGLADQGLSVPEIAERTGYHRGEVELVLSLREATRSEGGE